jgi:hypothetical protein
MASLFVAKTAALTQVGEGIMRCTLKALIVGGALSSLVFGPSALATGNQSGSDLTGTWEGTQICDELIGGEYFNFVAVTDQLLLVQEGNRLRFFNLDLVYEGVIQEVAGQNSREALAGVCGGEYEAQEIVRLRRIFTSGGEHDLGHFDADSIFFTDDFPEARGVLDFDTCKWAYERVSTERPNVPECTFPGIQPTH